ncbi:MAG TPA: flavin reductase family protein, partial [Acidimicrobiales bacterium]
RNLKLRLRYEYLNADVSDDPEPWEPDADDLAAIEEEIRAAVEREAFTHELIAGSGVYALCLVDREDRAIVRKFTKPVDADLEAHTLNGFPYFDGPATGAPVLAQSVASLECEVRQPVEVGNHTLFLGEIVNAAFLKDEETPVLRMEDTRMNYGG